MGGGVDYRGCGGKDASVYRLGGVDAARQDWGYMYINWNGGSELTKPPH